MDKKEAYVTLKIKENTKKRLIQMQGLFQIQHGEKISIDLLINSLIDSQPEIDLSGTFKKPIR